MAHTKVALIALLFIGISSIGCKKGPNSLYEPIGTRELGLLTKNGVVVSSQPQASDIGAAILAQGGNAYDAAVATHFALAVCLPKAGNIGGGGLAVMRSTNGEITTLDFREKAPLAAHRDMYLDQNGDVIDRASLEGGLASGVPGSVAGMYEMHQRYGSMPWEDLLQPSVDLANNGFAITAYQAGIWTAQQDLLQKHSSYEDNPFLRDRWVEGDTIVQWELAQTLSRIRDHGVDGFYQGKTADLLVDRMQASGGIITTEDLKKYQAKWRESITTEYRGYTLHAMPPPSSGGIILAQMLEGIEDYPLDSFGFGSPEAIHLMTEVERRSFADRATYMGDVDFVEVPMLQLLSPEYILERNRSISMERATPSSEIKEGAVDVIESIETTHYSVVDAQGNAVSVTTTLNSLFGSKVYVDGAGFYMNNEMDDFSVKPGVANQFGLVGNEYNAVQPEKRMLSSMTPTIVEKDGDLFMVLGSPGGSTIITTVFQVILNAIDHSMSMQEAVDAPRFHHQWLPDRILYEDGKLDNAVAKELEVLGHELEKRPQIGRVNAIMKTEDGMYEGAPDRYRGDGKAASY